MTDLDYYTCRGQIPSWNQNSAGYTMPGLQMSSGGRHLPVRMRNEISRCYRTSVQQSPQQQQQQQPKILYNLLMQPESRNDAAQVGTTVNYVSNNHLMPSDASHQFSCSGDFLVPVGRPRSRSMGASGWRMPDVMPVNTASRTPSRDSLASYDGSIASDESAVRWGSVSSGGRADLLLEDARSKLMTLSTKSDGSPSYYESDVDTRSLSQPGSPHTPIQAFRKYSEGSQLRSRFQHLRSGYRSTVQSSGSDHPVDLSCKWKKVKCTPALPYARRATISHHVTSNVSLDEGIDDDSSSETSILKSILTGRVRSNSMSVCGNRHATAGDLGDLAGKLNPRQHVALAKKNLLPVKARITDLLNKSIDFACHLQCFTALPVADQRSLLVSAAPRLLLLEMARSNIQFAVTPVHGSGSQLAEEGEVATAAGDDTGKNTSQSSPSQDSAEMPTQQFVESVQNFVRRCQQFGISTEEYFYMRLIALFQLGNSFHCLFCCCKF